MKTSRQLKTEIYEQIARIGKAMASAKRIEMIEMLAQGEKSVDVLAQALSIDVKLCSAHLRALKAADLVVGRREGKFIFYRISGPDVARLNLEMREVAQEHLLALQLAVRQFSADPSGHAAMDRKTLLQQARRGEVVLIDVRPQEEFNAAHLPFARSMPLDELARRLKELPKGVTIVAYCRGPYCLMSDEAVSALVRKGYSAHKTSDGVSEWARAGMPLESTASIA